MKTGEKKKDVIVDDGGIRVSSMEKMATLRTPFKENGTVTAGSASQLTDGVAVTFLASRKFAVKNRLPILAKFL